MRIRVAIPAGAAMALALLSPAIPAAALGAPAWASGSPATSTGDTLVTVGSPAAPFSQNKQNEPAITVDANHPNVLVAGANEEIDMEACNAGDPTTCPFTPGVGVSGVYFSTDSGQSWTQPTYQGGWTARDCLGPAACTAHVGAIGTLPGYLQSGLVSDGDPAVSFGPKPDSHGTFSWSNGSRLYYANLAHNFGGTRQDQTFKGFEAIYVSRTDNVAAAASGDATAWADPVQVSKQSSTTFSDKEQVWADNAQSSPFFGNVYVCWADFRSNSRGNALPTPLMVATSTDGGTSWTVRQASRATNNGQLPSFDACTIRTDSHGNVYAFAVGADPSTKQHFEYMLKSSDGGAIFTPPRAVAGPVTRPGIFDPVIGRTSADGLAGARNDLTWAPSVDIANGAPSGSDATNRIVMTYITGTTANPHVQFTESSDQGATFAAPRNIEVAGDFGYYTAPAISPNGSDVYVVYNAFTTPYQPTTATVRGLVGVVLHADVTGGGTGAFSQIHRGMTGDPRGSSQNGLTAEFLGDYVYATATRTYGAAVWNDTRNAADCPAIDTYRQLLRTNPAAAVAPNVQVACLPAFGNSDIYGGSFPDPTP
jgi:hypothetical protein